MNTNDKILFLDLATPHRELQEELVSIFRGVLKTACFVGGEIVEAFEREFAQFCETEFCVGVGSGTDALRFALTAAGVRQGDTVVTVPHTFVATAEAISQAGARPDFVDIEECSYNMSPQKLEQYFEVCCRLDDESGAWVNKKTGSPVTAVVPVHLYGQMADMDQILDVAARHNLLVIEDACQAHGSAYFSQRAGRWKKAGSMGDAAAFSFYPGKNLGACGEGGVVTTGNPAISARIRMLRDHGQLQKYEHEMEGYNGRLDALQAGILQLKLRHLSQWNQSRRSRAHYYDTLFRSQSNSVIVPDEPSRNVGNYHLYVIRVQDRDRLQLRLAEGNIQTQIHYPKPLHLQNAFARLRYKEGDFPVSEKIAAEILSLPMYPHLERWQQERVVQAVLDSCAELPPIPRSVPLPAAASL